MDKLSSSINGLIQEAEELNATKTAAVQDLEDRLITCPEQWQEATKEFIRAVKANIAARLKLINKLRRIDPFMDPKGVIKITHKLEGLDQDDDKAILKYNVAMDEGLN